MRTAFVNELVRIAEQDDRVWLIAGDLGFSVLEPFAERWPERFVNAGVAEQNMMGIAAGLALMGKVPYVYSIANFPVMRCLEQVRNDVCYHGLPVRVVSVGGGLVYGTLGYTHHGVEDIAVMRAMPGMSVFAPADPVEARLVARALPSVGGPAYIRLTKAGDPVLHDAEPEFELGRPLRMRAGSDITLISTGGALATTLEVCDLLAAKGVSAGVWSMPSVSPMDAGVLRGEAARVGVLATIEDHGPVGGLHSAVLEAVAPEPVKCLRFSLTDVPACVAGSAKYLGSASGLDVASIAAVITEALGR